MNDPSVASKSGGGRHHLIVRADVLRPPTREAVVIPWLMRLIAGIGMTLAEIPGNPLFYYCATPGNRGLTATAIIETSNITLHTWDERSPAELQLDVFTCGALDAEAVMRFVGEFEPVQCDAFVLDRRDGIRWYHHEQPKFSAKTGAP
jgi:S-adenosylmethionine/arginine decarboxylase-like enzyme